MRKGHKFSDEERKKYYASRSGEGNHLRRNGLSPEHKVKLLKDRLTQKPNWKGGRKYTTQGYVEVYSPEHPFRNKMGYVKEHRLVMEKHLGRYLDQKEVVHHINAIRDDNRIENLDLFSDRSAHAYHHQLGCKNGAK